MCFDMVVATTATVADRKIHLRLFERIDWLLNLLKADCWEKIRGYLIFFYFYY